MKSQNNEEPLAEVLTVEQVQQRLGISRGSVYNLLKRRLLERAYVGEVIRRTLITRESVERLAQSKKPEPPVSDQSLRGRLSRPRFPDKRNLVVPH